MHEVVRRMFHCNRLFASSMHLTSQRMFTSQSLQVGDEVKALRCFTQEDVDNFASLTGDFNPIHLDNDYARKSGLFKSTIVHGVMLNGFVTSLIGTKLPGYGSIAVSQEMRFPNPLYVNETVEGQVKVTALKKHFVFCSFLATVGDKTVLEGTATVMLSKS